MKYIDVSGLGNSGKSVIVDFLREFENVHAPHNLFEFDIFRRPYGIFDLHHHISENWSLIRSNQAVIDFKRFTKSIGGYGKRKSVRSILFSSGTEFDLYFGHKFNSLSREYVDSFVIKDYETFWPYYLDTDSAWVRFSKKIRLKFFKSKPPLSKVNIVDGVDFKNKTKAFLDNLYKTVATNKTEYVVMNNAFDAFNPVYGLDILESSQSIIVIRDPRDIYVSALNKDKVSSQTKSLLPQENSQINKAFVGTNNIDEFVLRQKILFQKLYRGKDSKVLVLKFEDIILNYEDTRSKVMSFLKIDENKQTKKHQFFNPEFSKKNVHIYEKYENKAEIEYIEKGLKEYLIEFGYKL